MAGVLASSVACVREDSRDLGAERKMTKIKHLSSSPAALCMHLHMIVQFFPLYVASSVC